MYMYVCVCNVILMFPIIPKKKQKVGQKKSPLPITNRSPPGPRTTFALLLGTRPPLGATGAGTGGTVDGFSNGTGRGMGREGGLRREKRWEKWRKCWENLRTTGKMLGKPWKPIFCSSFKSNQTERTDERFRSR